MLAAAGRGVPVTMTLRVTLRRCPRDAERLAAAGVPVRLGKGAYVEPSKLANDTGLAIQVCHFPPGTSKWNKIEHRLFSFISRNWRGQPLVSRQAIVSLIGATTSTAGLKVYAQLDEGTYERSIKVPDAELAAVNLTRDQFHGKRNYIIKPQTC